MDTINISWTTLGEWGANYQQSFEIVEGVISGVAFLALAASMLLFAIRVRTIVRFFHELRDAEKRLQLFKDELPAIYKKLAVLTGEVDDLRRGIEPLNGDVAVLKSGIERVKADLEVAPTRIDDVLDEMAKLSGQLDALADEARAERSAGPRAANQFTPGEGIRPAPSAREPDTGAAAWEDVGAIWRDMKAEVEDVVAGLRSEERDRYNAMSRKNYAAIIDLLETNGRVNWRRAELWRAVDQKAMSLRARVRNGITAEEVADVQALARALKTSANGAAAAL